METTGIIKQHWLKLLRFVKYIDFPLQTAVLILAAVFSIIFRGEDDCLFILLLSYLIMGFWQLFSAILFMIARAPFRDARIVHLALSVVCLLYFRDPKWSGPLLLVPPALLALFYYGITARWTFLKPQTGGFLRHINF